jgi:enoyl-[acyl-carrier protein] reductase/trans-2-enoyl-CoA reductase (NAD+)
MVVEPRVKDFICTTAHPVGCAANVNNQIEYVKGKGIKKEGTPKKVLVIGSSTGYGLASRIAVAFGYGADTLGVMFEKESNGRRTASAGFYNNRAFEEAAAKEGLYAKTINGDAFSREIKNQVIDTIKSDLGQVDMIVYSLAAPRRTTEDGTKYTSVLKTVGDEYTNKTLVLKDNSITQAHISSANEGEIQATIKVMGGEDWIDWMQALTDAGVLADKVITVAYSYIGPEITFPIYAEGSIGQAKKDLYNSCDIINERFPNIKAKVAINKALVTQSSAAIPVVPLYITLLYKVMKDKGIHEGCIEQMQRLFLDKILDDAQVDDRGFVRMDDWEMRDDVQSLVAERWNLVDNDNVAELADIDGYWEDFYHMFGFKIEGVDYSADVEIM